MSSIQFDAHTRLTVHEIKIELLKHGGFETRIEARGQGRKAAAGSTFFLCFSASLSSLAFTTSTHPHVLRSAHTQQISTLNSSKQYFDVVSTLADNIGRCERRDPAVSMALQAIDKLYPLTQNLWSFSILPLLHTA